MESPSPPPTPAVAVPPPAPPRRSRRGLLIVAIVVVAAVVVVAGLYLGQVGPFAGSSTPSAATTATGPTYAQALSTAQQNASGYGGGSWGVVLATGADPNVGLFESTALPGQLNPSGGCPGTSETNGAGVVGFDGFSGNLSLGEAPSWLFFLTNASGAILVTVVTESSAHPLELYAGLGCGDLAALGTLAANITGSASASAAAMNGGGYAFVAAHPGGSLVLSVAQAGGPGGWSFDYTTCPADGQFSASTTYYNFTATVSLTEASLVGTPTSGVGQCTTAGLDLAAALSHL